MTYTRTDEYLSTEGARIFVRNIVPDGEPVRESALVFLHEALGSVEQWKTFPDELCAALGCKGLAYDRQGHGFSDPINGVRSIDFYKYEAGTVLRGLLREYGIEKPVLVGHSDGATIALSYASQFPEDVSGVVSEAAHVLIEEVTLKGIRRTRDSFYDGGLKDKLVRFHGEKTDAVFSAWADTWLKPENGEWNMFAELESIGCPLLLIQGKNDEYGSRLQLDAIAAHAGGPVETAMLPDCGHIPHHQARDITIERIKQFADSIA